MDFCHICYRELPDELLIKGEKMNICQVCKSILGKGPGYACKMSDEEIDKWLEGMEERKKKLREQGRLSW